MSIFDKLRAKLKPEPKSLDEAVRDALREHGDDGTKIRTVDHFAYFNTEHETAAYMTFVQDLGFSLQESNKEFGVAFSKESAVVGQDFDREIGMLTIKAQQLNGQYDGWGCPVAD